LNAGHLVLRNVCYYRRTGLVVAFGVAVASACITGSLLVGSSVRGSLRTQALARLGRADYALVAPHYFREALVREVAEWPAVKEGVQVLAPAIFELGVVQNADNPRTAPKVNVYAVDAAFWELFPGVSAPDLGVRRAAVNAALAHDLGLPAHEGPLEPGVDVLVNLERDTPAPAGTLFADRKREKTLHSLRVTLAAVLPGTSGPGAFAPLGGTGTPRNLFVSREWLAEVTRHAGQVNAVYLAVAPGRMGTDTILDGQNGVCPPFSAVLEKALRSSCKLEDLGLKLVPNAAQRYVALESSHVVLREDQVRTACGVAKGLGGRPAITSVYLADTIRVRGGEKAGSAYALVAGLDPLQSFSFESGGEQPLDPDGLWLTNWLAQDLGAQVGSPVELDYLVPSWDGLYRTRRKDLTVRGIVKLEGPARDRGLTPQIEGVTTAEKMDAWATPFPIARSRITARDDAYWEEYRTTPKAYVHPEVAREMWGSGNPGTTSGDSIDVHAVPGLSPNGDWVTSVRVQPPAGEELAAFTARLDEALRKELTPAGSGLVFRPVRAEALAGSVGTTDFGSLFLGLSFFIVASAAGLTGMLMRLLAERRAAEAGLLLACGFRGWAVLALICAEGALLSLLGAAAGVPCGLAYAAGLVGALNGFWSSAVAGTVLQLHVRAEDLWVGGLAGLGVGVAAVIWGARTIIRRPVLELLGGWRALGTRGNSGTDRTLGLSPNLPRVKALVAGLLGLACSTISLSLYWRMVSPTVAFFAGGAVLLLAGLAASYLWLCRAGRPRGGAPNLARFAKRNAALYRSRSLLVIGLAACASFILVTVAANRRDSGSLSVTEKKSGAGGFALRAVTALPLRYDLAHREGRRQLGFTDADEEAFQDAEVYSFLLSPGDDISCLNPAKPARPRVLGASARMIERGGFKVAGSLMGWKPLTFTSVRDAIPAFGDAASVQWNLHSGLGQTFALSTPAKPVPVIFVGVLPDSIFAGEIVVSEAHFRRIFPDVDAPRYFLISTPPQREDSVAQVLRERLGDFGVEVRSTREILAAYLSVQNTYLSVFLALGGLGLLLGGVGLLTVLLRSALERRAEFALLLAVGFERGTPALLMVLEHAGLLLAGLAVGTAASLLAVAPVFLAADSAVHWPGIVAWLGGVFLFGMLGCVLAARAASRGLLLDALRSE
jgi:ABC-type antimicrobial peptide transport system permease subunit